MLTSKQRLSLDRDVEAWTQIALAYPGFQLLPLTPAIAIESTRLPGTFHADPADRIIVATARVLGCRLLTMDRMILDYPHVDAARP